MARSDLSFFRGAAIACLVGVVVVLIVIALLTQ